MFRLELSVPANGWITCKISNEQQCVEVEVSYIPDVVRALLTVANQLESGAKNAKWNFTDERFTYQCEFNTIGNSLISIRLFRMVEFEKSNQKRKSRTLCWSARVPIRVFAAEVLLSVENMLNACEVGGYAEQWSRHPFPLSELLYLKDLLQRG